MTEERTKLPTLYGHDSKMRVKVWNIWVEDDTIHSSSGLLGGKVARSKPVICKSKNVGRANETTPHEQALSEAESKWKKKLDKSYCEDPNNIKGQGNPMLANPYKKWNGPYYGQPKLDGVRGLVQYNPEGTLEIKSRGGKNYPIPDHLKKPLSTLLKLNGGRPLDGELYIHGEPLNRIVSCAKKYNDLTPRLEFHIFDVVLGGVFFEDRLLQQMVIREHCANLKISQVKVVDYIWIEDEDDIVFIHDEYVEAGYEGLILRKPKGVYLLDHRSPDLLKYKHFKDAEWLIVDIIEDEKGQGMGRIVCYCPESTDPDDDTFIVVMGSHEERAYQLQNKEEFIGKALTVKYQAKTKYNKPQFGVGVCLREGHFEDNIFIPAF